MFECECDCGNKKTVQGHRLKQGITKSCGCYYREIFENGKNSSERSRARAARYRAKKLGIDVRNSHSAKDIIFIHGKQFGKCFYCESVLLDYHVDHMVHLTRGGDNSKENICLTCTDCNRKKHTKTASEFLQVRGCKF